MISVVIFISKYENAIEGANLIKSKLKNCQIIEIEKFIKEKEIIENAIIYFLCNTKLIQQALTNLKNCYIYNENYYLKNYKKLDVQKVLDKNNLNIPKLIKYESIKNIDFPIFCKENIHVGITFQVYNQVTLERFFSKFNIKNFYFETSLLKINNTLNEYKVYYVDGYVTGKNNSKKISNKIKKICSKISHALGLNIFSIDVIESSDNYYIIDVNPASSFYLSDLSRKKFIYKIKEIAKSL